MLINSELIRTAAGQRKSLFSAREKGRKAPDPKDKRAEEKGLLGVRAVLHTKEEQKEEKRE